MFRRRPAPHPGPTTPAGTQPIAEALPRSRVRIAGEIVRMRQRPASGLPSLVVTIEDGTGSATAVWSGRRSIGGVGLGRRLVLEGVVVETAEGKTLLNPGYVLLA